MTVLLNNAANSTRVLDQQVSTSFDSWKSHYETIRASDAFLTDRYNNLHNFPRIEKEAAEHDYYQQKQEKYLEWLSTKSKTALVEYVSIQPPQKTSISQQIYTKYV
jgi:hypothetical protein